MHTQDSSFLSDWQRQRLSIHVDRAVTELRRGRPLLMVDANSIDSLLPKGVQGPSNVWLFAAVETLTPDGWERLRRLSPLDLGFRLLLSGQRIETLARQQGWSNLMPGKGSNLERQDFEQPFELFLMPDQGSAALPAIRACAGLDGEIPREVALLMRYQLLSLAGDPQASDWGAPHQKVEPARTTSGEAPWLAQPGVSSPPLQLARSALALAREARLAPAVVCYKISSEQAHDLLDAGLMHVDPAQVQAFVATRPIQLEQVSDAPVPLASAWAADREAAARGDGTQPVGAVGGDAAQSGGFAGRADGDHAIDSRFVVFREKDSDFEHVAVIVGNPDFNGKEPVRVRLHSSCLTGDLFGSLRCDCGDQLRGTVQRLAKDGGGIVLYLSQEGRGIGIANKLRAYRRQDAGLDTLDANHALGFRMDERHFEVAAAMLKSLGCTHINLLTNNPAKIAALRDAGIDVVEREGVKGGVNAHNQRYLLTKMKRGGHLFDQQDLQMDADSTSGGMSGMASAMSHEGTMPEGAVQTEAGHATAEGRSASPAQALGIEEGAGRLLPTAASGAEGADASPEGRPLSVAIRERLQFANRRFHANDNIADFIHDEAELDALQDEVAERMQALLESLVIDTESDHNTQDTARRVARMYLNEVFAGRYRKAPAMTEFPNVEKLNELLVVGPITVRSACSHHFCPIMGRLWIGVLPNADSNLIGLSKYARLADWIMSRPQIQEEAVKTLADELERRLVPNGLAVVMKADHFCMHWRGVKDESQMTSSVMRGAFLRNASLRREFLGLI
ncbi:GTP cyclohydrolase-2 [Lautropia mirabilis]|uniref:GTP cyclohydrolase-2 n=1 Tax=Lautropia mirabilis ATCC 51599 TaxID=887898 RepID=E7RY13_9BURK|nr:putative GTP cyclohydrolase I [Lautropia mirabilis ATCC 51599]VEH01004.1 GTP cyclohydrolase-2 [Lautropia mirabilis]